MAANSRRSIEGAQSTLRTQLAARHFRITGSATTLVNAVFVATSADRLAELKALPNVLGVVRLHRYKRTLNTATRLLHSTEAWSLLGGMPNAGAGVKIGIIDSGIDQNHPSLQDPTLTLPAGFPKCSAATDCTAFTNSKVIVARSYVRQLALGTGAIDPATSRADDYSARDRSGHGTAVATCAAGNTSTGTVTINGMAPKAWLGSYKVFGSPQVNDFSSEDILIAALEDALADGMDIVSMSVGGAAFTGPLDTGAACGQAAGVPCDIGASAFEAMANKGVLIVVAAGNEGSNGLNYPTLNSISSPADAPGVLTVGGFANSHAFTPAVRIPGAAVPAPLRIISAQPTDSGTGYGAYAAPLVDVGKISSDPYACSALPAFSLSGSFALIQRGGPAAGACTFAAKMANAVNAKAAGAIFYDTPNDARFPFSPSGLSAFPQPSVLLSNSDGLSLKDFIATNPGSTVIIDPSGAEIALPDALNNQLVYYSSMGPSLGINGIKPELLSVAGGGQNGDLIFMGAQTFDPLGDVYSATGYTAAAGTSFATPLTAGAAALVKQAHPSWSAGQIKSALVNTASQDVTTDDSGTPVTVLQTGAGKLAADLAIRTTITVEPSTLSFGVLKNALPGPITLRIGNPGASPVTLSLAISPTGTASSASVSLDKTNVTLAAGAVANVVASLAGTLPASGLYAGAVTISGGAVPLRVPYMFLSGSTTPANFTVLLGGGDGTVGLPIPEGAIAFQITDANGVPVADSPVSFAVGSGSVPVTLSDVSATTDAYGIAFASVTLGSQPGQWVVSGCLSRCAARNQFQTSFGGTARPAPTVLPGGVTNSAASNGNQPLAPGSYFSIYGTGLSDLTDLTPTAGLPIAIDAVNVSFDVPSAGLSIPAHLVFVSPGQINAQVPWELQGQTAAQMKVTLDTSYSNVVTVPIASYAPALFENPLGSGVVAAIDPLNIAAPVISSGSPAKRGSIVALYANGLGAVSHQPLSGEIAAGSDLARTLAQPTVTIGGQPAAVAYSGLTPGLPGLYQLNVTVPSGVAVGSQPVVVTIGGQTSKALSIPVN